MHFECVIRCDLKPDTPQQVINTLRCMIGQFDEFDDPPSAPLFEFDGWLSDPRPDGRFWGQSWRYSLRPHGHIAPDDDGPVPYAPYFAGPPESFFGRTYKYILDGVDQFRYTLSARVVMIDDSYYSVWPRLLNWLVWHSETEGFVGYSRALFDLHPALVYFHDGQVLEQRVCGEPTPMDIPDDSPED